MSLGTDPLLEPANGLCQLGRPAVGHQYCMNKARVLCGDLWLCYGHAGVRPRDHGLPFTNLAEDGPTDDGFPNRKADRGWTGQEPADDVGTSKFARGFAIGMAFSCVLWAILIVTLWALFRR